MSESVRVQQPAISKELLLLSLIFILELLALPAQFYLLLRTGEFTFVHAVVRFFSFFTVLTNSIVAVTCIVLLFGKKSKVYDFFRQGSTLTAVTVYILIVGVVYNIILRPLQHLDGLHRITTEIFHTVVPLLFLLYWIMFVKQENLGWKLIPAWLIYPLIYVVYTLLHGWYTGFYPYPFIDINKLGFDQAMLNGLFVLLSIIVLSFVLITAKRMMKRELNPN
ncbi:MAG TPA: Pr6Pr family membrane protein [Cyclobacteriaceae bacterium]|nr:Pr6Pr family membrane protein [Cyclobacteriaceae bacterium]